MSSLKEKVSYLQGLIEGLDISEATKEGKAIKVITEILTEMANEVEEISNTQEDIQDYIDSIDEDLSDLEEEVYGEDFIEVECPRCGETIEVDSSVLDDPDAEIVCPECGKEFTPEEIDWDFVEYEDEDEDEEDEEEDEDEDEDEE